MRLPSLLFTFFFFCNHRHVYYENTLALYSLINLKLARPEESSAGGRGNKLLNLG